MSIVRKDLGNRIRDARVARGLSQVTLAELAGVSPQYLGQLERGLRDPSLGVAVRVARALGVSVDWLATGETSHSDELYEAARAMPPQLRELALRLMRAMADVREGR